MEYSYILLAAAQEEYEASLLWYLERSPQSALSFEENVDHALTLICTYPHRWRNVYQNYFELAVKKYPFNLVYTIVEDQKLIVIHSIYHHSRNPGRKFNKQ